MDIFLNRWTYARTFLILKSFCSNICSNVKDVKTLQIGHGFTDMIKLHIQSWQINKQRPTICNLVNEKVPLADVTL